MPVSPYGVSKLACEALASAYDRSVGLDAVGMRFFSVYGPRQRPDMAFRRSSTAWRSDSPFRLFGNGRQSRDFTYVGDIVEATLAAMASGTSGRVYNVGGGSEISLLDALALCEQSSAAGSSSRTSRRRPATRAARSPTSARPPPSSDGAGHDARGGAARAGRERRSGRYARAGPGAEHGPSSRPARDVS